MHSHYHNGGDDWHQQHWSSFDHYTLDMSATDETEEAPSSSVDAFMVTGLGACAVVAGIGVVVAARRLPQFIVLMKSRIQACANRAQN